jgi:hypothetical protein
MKITVENSELLNKIHQLVALFNAGEIERLDQHEVNPGLDKGSRENYLYFTLPVCINFQRSSTAMWKSALATYEDPETNYLFFPEEVIIRTREQIQQSLIKHKLALQPNKHTDIWIAICNALNYYDNDPRKVIKAGQNCAVRIKNILQVSDRDRFPYLRGQKLANYWLFILHNFTDIKLRNLHKISIIPDTHVIQASRHLGISTAESTPEQIAELWFDLLKNTNLTPIDVHPVLWNWSRAGFKPEI